MASGEQAGLFRVSIYQTLRARGPDPDLTALSEAVDFCAESIESAGDCKVSRGEFRQHRSCGLEPAARPRRARAGAQVPDRQRRRHAAAGRDEVRVADRDPVRVRRPRPHRRAAEPLRRGARQPHAGDRRPLGVGQDDDRKRAAVALPGGRRARVRDRPRRPLRDAHPAGRRRAADRDRRRRLPVRAEPVGRAGSGEGLAGEDRVPARAAPGDDGRPRRAADRDDRRRDPRRVRQGGRAVGQPAARVDAPGRAPRAGQGGAGRRTRSTSPRRCATSPTACPSTAARAPTPTCSTATRPSPPTRRWWCSTPAAARNRSCGS